jgi:hypothetical protein
MQALFALLVFFMVYLPVWCRSHDIASYLNKWDAADVVHQANHFGDAEAALKSLAPSRMSVRACGCARVRACARVSQAFFALNLSLLAGWSLNIESCGTTAVWDVQRVACRDIAFMTFGSRCVRACVRARAC